MKRKEIVALTENDFLGVLKDHGLQEGFSKGELLCALCKRTISIENLLSFKKTVKGIEIYCNRPDCNGVRND
jgi:hypothetical protein